MVVLEVTLFEILVKNQSNLLQLVQTITDISEYVHNSTKRTNSIKGDSH